MFCKKCWIDFKECEPYVLCIGPCQQIFHEHCVGFVNNYLCNFCENLVYIQFLFDISICDDYSLPVDFVKKRPSSFDPRLTESCQDNWIQPSPLSEHVTFLDQPLPPPQQHHSLSTSHRLNSASNHRNRKSHHQKAFHPPLPKTSTIPTTVNSSKKASVKVIEGYSDPKDSKKQRQTNRSNHHHRKQRKPNQDKRSHYNYTSDSSAPKSSAEEDDDEDNLSNRIPELNSPASITDDLVCALLPPVTTSTANTNTNTNTNSNTIPTSSSSLATTQLPTTINNSKSPKKVINESKPQSLYYYSDILKKREKEEQELKETKRKSRQSTSSEPAGTANQTNDFLSFYKKSSSLDVPDSSAEHHSKLIEIVETPNDVEKPEEGTPKRYSITEEGVRIIRCSTPSTTTSDDSDCSECQKRREWHAKALELVRKTCNIQAKTSQTEGERKESAEESMPPHRLLGPAVCACVAPAINDDIDEFFRPRSIFYVHAQGAHECEDCAPNPQLNKLHKSKSNSNSTKSRLGASDNSVNSVNTQDDEMSGKRRQVYETAFDCKITKSDDDLDEMDKISKHSVLLQINENGNKLKQSGHKSKTSSKRQKNNKNQKIQESEQQAITMMENIHIDNSSVDQMNNTTTIPNLGYTPSPPSTAPLPMKFPGKHDRFFMNSIKSAPNLPSSNPAHPRLKDLRLPIKSLQQQHQQQNATSNDSSLLDTSYMNSPPSVSRTRDRPRSIVLESGRVLELRKTGSHHHNQHHHHGSHTKRHNYSSTESMATSSSGSMESLRSSTSEGNRSTSSSESRHSTSLSSHSSDGPSVSFPLRAPVVIHSKLHILSPISDKSSQEQASEVSELSKKPSPIAEKTTHNDGESSVPTNKRRPPNKSLMQLKDEILGSDSGISLHSREENKSSVIQKLALPKLNFQSSEIMTDSGIGAIPNFELSIPSIGLPQDLRDLPFDIPKLRRRKVLIQQQDACTSGSATSVDLGDLPFDMPKLRRRLRMNQNEGNNLAVSTDTSGISQASSSHSVREENKVVLEFRQNLTLNLGETKQPKKFGSLDLRGLSSTSTANKGLNLNINNAFSSAVDVIDIILPLERQGWYHGAITRVEAENTLRPLSEGSFLVRNCESTKQDYSLSLK
ncbi:SHF family protein [Megaselia abdita]